MKEIGREGYLHTQLGNIPGPHATWSNIMTSEPEGWPSTFSVYVYFPAQIAYPYLLSSVPNGVVSPQPARSLVTYSPEKPLPLSHQDIHIHETGIRLSKSTIMEIFFQPTLVHHSLSDIRTYLSKA